MTHFFDDLSFSSLRFASLRLCSLAFDRLQTARAFMASKALRIRSGEGRGGTHLVFPWSLSYLLPCEDEKKKEPHVSPHKQ